jgi:hypothetical protein
MNLLFKIIFYPIAAFFLFWIILIAAAIVYATFWFLNFFIMTGLMAFFLGAIK